MQAGEALFTIWKGKRGVSFPNTNPNDRIFNAFIQDEVQIVPDKLSITAGTKIEYNNYTGVELQPSARTAWKITERQTIWGAVSRPSRTPSQYERNIINVGSIVPTAPPTLYEQIAGSELKSEHQLIYELGYRVQPAKRLSLDTALYYSQLSDMYGMGMLPPDNSQLPTYAIYPMEFRSGGYGHSYGAEVAATWQALDDWKLSAYYSFTRMDLNMSSDVFTTYDNNSPMHQAGLRSSVNLSKHWELDAGVRYVDSLSYYAIPSYVAADARLAWRPNNRWELALVGQNLVDRHIEFGSSSGRQIEIERSIYARLTIRF